MRALIRIGWIIILFLIVRAGSLRAASIHQDTIIYSTDNDTLEDVSDAIDEEFENDEELSTQSNGDTTYINLGRMRIKIIDEGDDTSLKIEKRKHQEEKGPCPDLDNTIPGVKKWKEFTGHWAGFEFGLNNYVDNNFSFSRNDENKFMDLEVWKSWNFNLNFAQYSVGFGSNHFGVLTGLGIEWSNYHFSDTNNIQKLGGKIEALDIPGNTQRNKMQTTYLTIPLLFEYQLPVSYREERPYFAAGIIGGIKLFSNTKIKYNDDGNIRKEKFRNDYYLAPLRYGLTFRAGYHSFKMYLNYYLSPLFLAGRGSGLHPVAAGLVISF